MILILSSSASFANKLSDLNSAVENQNWKKVYKIVSNRITGTKLKKGQYVAVFDSLISDFKKEDCVLDADWTRCGAKILIYPGQETISIKFKTPDGEVEKSFQLQTSKYQTHKRFLGLRIRIPTIDKKQLVCYGMTDHDDYSMIESMRKICVWEKEYARQRAHTSKVFFKAQILGGDQDRSFPPLNFDCYKQQTEIEFSATNTTTDSLKIYWPKDSAMCDPLFRINFTNYKPELNLHEDTLSYILHYDTVILAPNETIRIVQSLKSSRFRIPHDATGNEHFYLANQLDAFHSNFGANGTARIGYAPAKNSLTWEEDEIWKPAGGPYIFHLAGYSIQSDCQ